MCEQRMLGFCGAAVGENNKHMSSPTLTSLTVTWRLMHTNGKLDHHHLVFGAPSNRYVCCLLCCWCPCRGLVESAFEFASICRKHDYHTLCLASHATSNHAACHAAGVAAGAWWSLRLSLPTSVASTITTTCCSAAHATSNQAACCAAGAAAGA
jgi:hypothetical protein